MMSEHVGGVEMMSEHVRRVGMTRFLDRHGEELPEPAQRVADHPAHLHPLCSARGRIPLHTHPAVAHHQRQGTGYRTIRYALCELYSRYVLYVLYNIYIYVLYVLYTSDVPCSRFILCTTLDMYVLYTR